MRARKQQAESQYRIVSNGVRFRIQILKPRRFRAPVWADVGRYETPLGPFVPLVFDTQRDAESELRDMQFRQRCVSGPWAPVRTSGESK